MFISYLARLQNINMSINININKAKYHPSCSLQEHLAKPHHSWFWKNIRNQGSNILREGKWCVGDGYNIPLNHPDWFNIPNLDFNNPVFPTGTVVDLIDHNTKIWKLDIVGMKGLEVYIGLWALSKDI